MPDIRLPNGKIIKNIPEGVTREEVMQKAIAGGFATEEDFAPKVSPTEFESIESEQERSRRELAEEVGPVESALIGVGRGLTNVGRGLGLADEEPPEVKAAIGELQEQRPITSIGGEIAGEVAPFLAPGLAVGGIASLPARVAASTGLGALEGGVLSAGQGGDVGEVVQSAGTGAVISGGLEAIFPKLSRLGGEIYRRVKGTPAVGALFDRSGNPLPEMEEALGSAGLSFNDLVGEAQSQVIKESQGAVPEQLSRKALFSAEGIPATAGEVTQSFPQQATEQRLLQSAADPLSDSFRSFKLAQSEAIDKSLRSAIPSDISDSFEAGESIKDALVNNRSLLKSQKNALYREAADAAENVQDIPIMFGDITESMPSMAEQRRCIEKD